MNQNHNHEAVTYLNANFQADKDHINTLKEEIEFLKKMLGRCIEK